MKNGSLENHLKADFLEIELREHRLLKVKFVIIMIIIISSGINTGIGAWETEN